MRYVMHVRKMHLGVMVGTEPPNIRLFLTSFCFLFSCPELLLLEITWILHALAGCGIDLLFAAHLDFKRDEPPTQRLIMWSVSVLNKTL